MGLAADMVWLLFSNVSGIETIAYQVYDVMAGLYTTSHPPVLAHIMTLKIGFSLHDVTMLKETAILTTATAAMTDVLPFFPFLSLGPLIATMIAKDIQLRLRLYQFQVHSVITIMIHRMYSDINDSIIDI